MMSSLRRYLLSKVIKREKLLDLTVFKACYDNPIFDQEDSRAYATQNGPSRTGKPGDYGADAFEDGMEGRGYATNCRVDSCHVANDYMHSLPVSPPLRNDIVFRSHRKRSRIILFLLVFLVVMAAITVGLLFHFVGKSVTFHLVNIPTDAFLCTHRTR
ncbi:hypothetical protein BgiBS90_004288 [Biomphalaria glabrata]|nr:hypothetical protein BgiBS90_004288 [Biomphalaria glabrata]